MSIEKQMSKSIEFQPEKAEDQTLDEFLKSLQQEGITPLSAEVIKKQLKDTSVAIVTRDYNCGIRISREGSKFGGYKYRTWTTNDLENPNHPLSQKFARKDIEID